MIDSAQDTSRATMIETGEPSNWPDDFQFDNLQIEAGTTHHRRRRLVWLIVPAIVILVAGVIWFENPFATAATTPVTATATTGTIVTSVSISGSVASSTVKELAFPASGTVTAVNVAVGDAVTSGEVLATIDDTELQAQLDTARANLASAQARLALDQAAPDAATKASAKDAVSQAKLQLSTANQSLSDTRAQNSLNISQARAAVTAAKATLSADKKALPAGDPQIAKDQAAVTSAQSALSAANLKATLSLHQAQAQVKSATLAVTTAEHNYSVKTAPTTAAQIASDKASVASAQQAVTTLEQTGTSITAPVAGTVTAVNIVVGETVSGSSGSSASSSSTTSGQIEIMDLTSMQIAGEASETDVAKLKMGQPATITAATLGTDTLVGQICALSVVGTQISGVTSFPVTVCITGSNPALLVGMSATAAVVTDRADNAVLVPSLAVKTVGGQHVVAVLGADGKTETNVPVTVGITNGSETQILTGLNAGATVVETLQTTTQTNRGGGFGGPGGVRVFQGGGFGGD
jgi:multidrug efflux pump subunit AcrA (membrane-fusion protein)